eukprot:CAMPEP_0178996550 /NCGR_PEP_ID=MMETSP0795-20121207/8425_1 /TAXON_ID=88552 /ORGANISM="Amoebophrya sp., Strain Ameob2" /LENGTH=222 /DNA_ID=CAMNT_0020688941 /DNA_START=1449 /DNA_END=2114 /DNA_ORIENTATION=-
MSCQRDVQLIRYRVPRGILGKQLLLDLVGDGNRPLHRRPPLGDERVRPGQKLSIILQKLPDRGALQKLTAHRYLLQFRDRVLGQPARDDGPDFVFVRCQHFIELEDANESIPELLPLRALLPNLLLRHGPRTRHRVPRTVWVRTFAKCPVSLDQIVERHANRERWRSLAFALAAPVVPRHGGVHGDVAFVRQLPRLDDSRTTDLPRRGMAVSSRTAVRPVDW